MSNFCQQGDITKIFIVDTGNTGSTGTDIYVTGGTYFGGTLTLGRNDGVTIPITGFSTTSIFTGNTSANCISNLYISNLHGCSPITIWDPIVSLSSISATTYYGDGSNLSGIPDYYVTGGTYSNGSLTLNRQNGIVTVTGFSTTDTYVTGFTYNDANRLTISQNGGQSPLTVTINNFTGLTVTGSISATTYLNLPPFITGFTDNFVTGGTFSSGTLTLNRQNGIVTVTGFTSTDTFVTGFTFTNDNTLTIGRNQGLPPLPITINNLFLTGLTVNGSISASTYLNLPAFITGFTDNFVTGGTFSSGTLTLNRQNGSVFITGFTTSSSSGGTDTFVTGFTFTNNNTLTIDRNQGLPPLPVIINNLTLTGLTVNGVISASTYLNLPAFITGFTDTYVTGFTYNDANRLTISQNGGQPPLNVFINTFTGITTHYLDVNTNVTETSAVGRLNWNNTDGTLDLGLKGGNVTLQIGQEQVVRVVNKTGANLLESQYKVARIRSQAEGGSQGQRLAIVLAQANNDPNSVDTLGIVTENIDNNQEGFITSSGLVRNINTTGSLQSETWLDGDVLYLSPITAGELTKVKPIAPQHTVIMGYVVYAHVNNGKIFVKVDNGYELDELHNVRISGETNNQVLSYDSVQSVWVNRTLPAFITGFTDNFVTGGTYSSGTLTLNRQNGSVIITGFTTSSSSGGTSIDTFVTGFTYSNNNLSINQNQGQSPLSVTINNFTGLTVNGSLSASTYLGLPSFTFTGNTSASCISDIYVSNLHGCSPITIHDSIKSVGSSATGITSFAFGNTTVAAGDYSHAEGELTQAIGGGSHAEGNGTITVGGWSHAEGYGTQANGGWSHAEGYVTQAIGDYSHAEGNSTYTGQYFYTTIGVSSGVITLDRTYGDVSAEFTATGIILEDAGPFTWYELDPSSSPYFDGTNTIIYLADTSVNSGTYIGVPGVFQPTAADILLGNFYSHAEGYGTIAIGNSSHAEGRGTSAIGDYSHAEGYGTQANGGWSHAEGYFTTAIGGWSHAEGESTTSSGAGSHAEGISTQAIGDYSHSEGYYTTAIGANSHAEGESTTAIGANSHAEGGNTEASGQYSHTEGVGTDASGTGSHAEGSGGKNYGSIGDYSHTEGRQTTTNGDYSHAEGYLTSTNVKGLYSHAEGHGSQAGDIGSHAEGYFTQANGNYSHSQGTNTIASGDYSFASGSASTASGIASFIHSSRSVVTGNRSVVLGGQGISGTSSDFVYVSNLNINSIPVSNSGGTQVLVRNSSTGNIEYNSNIQVQIDALKVEEVNLQDIGTGLPASTYTIVLNAKYARRINELTVIAGSGTCTLTMNINNTPVTGISGVSVTTTGTTYTTTATNVVAVGNTVTMVTISNSGLANLRATIKTTR